MRELADLHRLFLDVEFADFDARCVEHIIDEFEQMFARVVNILGVFGISRHPGRPEGLVY